MSNRNHSKDSVSTLSSSSSRSGDHPTACPFILNDTYRLIRVLGSGSTCEVWLASHVEFPDYLFAIKIMSPSYLQLKTSISCLQQEIHILRKLQHHSVVQMYEYGCDGVISSDGKSIRKGVVYIVMEYVEGPLLFDVC